TYKSCIDSFTITQSAINVNSSDNGNDAILGAVFNTPPGLSCCADNVKSRMTKYFPPNTFAGGIPTPPPPPPAVTTKKVEVVPTTGAGNQVNPTTAAGQVVPTSAAGSNATGGGGSTGGGSNGGGSNGGFLGGGSSGGGSTDRGSTGGSDTGSGSTNGGGSDGAGSSPSTSTITDGTSGTGSAIVNGTLVTVSEGVKPTVTATGQKAFTIASNAGSLTALSATVLASVAFMLLV
ncbi:hypothetical protein HDU98_004557, partial [Podochytrium sp. JEL0797]